MKKILIIGAGFLQAYVIKRAAQLGYETYVVDANPKSVGFMYAHQYRVINIVDKEACLSYARECDVDGVLTAATDYGVLTVSYIAEKLNLPGFSYSVAELIKNKYQVRKKLYECKVDDTEQAYEVMADTNFNALQKQLTFPVMVKPCDGSGSRGASRVDREENLIDACMLAIQNSLTGRAEIETFIVGQEFGVESFVEKGNIHVLGIMKKKMTKPPYYAELGHCIPSGLSKETEEKIRVYVTRAIKALGIDFGSVNMDILVTENGHVHIVDIGARMGGNLIGSHLIPIGTGIDYIGNMIKASVGDTVDFSSQGGQPVATRLLALTPGVVRHIPDFQALEKQYDVIIEQHIHTGMEITPYRTNLDGCGYVVVSSNCAEKNEEKAEAVKNIIDQKIERE